jgi:uncharacterized protein (DUF983 family)
MKEEEPVRGYLVSVLACRCPRCREGKLFKYPIAIGLKRNMEMHEQCPVCSQPTEIELGFYYGTGYVSYLLSLLIAGGTFLLWFLIIGFSFHDQRFLTWVIFNSVLLLVLQPWLMRFSRILWLSFFVRYDPLWREHKPEVTERMNKDLKDHW